MKCECLVGFFTLLQIEAGSGRNVFKIGAIFDRYSSFKQNAVQVAIEKINNNSKEAGHIFDVIIKEVPYNNPFETLKSTCSLLEEGVIGILGPNSEENCNVVQSICDAKDIPHINVRWDRSSTLNTIVNLYPHPNALNKIYLDVLEATSWKKFVIFYENNESLMRIGNLVGMYSENSTITIMQLDEEKTGNYRNAFAKARDAGATHFVVDCSIDVLRDVLLHAQQIGLMTRDYHYFITNPDMHTVDVVPFQYSKTNITGIRFIDPENSETIRIAAEILDKLPMKKYIAGWKLQIEIALIYDALTMFLKSVKSIDYSNVSALSCGDNSRFKYGITLLNVMKSMEHKGISGNISFDNRGLRSNFELDVIQLKEGGITKKATWNTRFGFNTFNQLERRGGLNRHFLIITALTEPYVMLDESKEPYDNDRYEGFCIDLLKELSNMCGFNYTILIRNDAKNGEYNDTTKRWTGMIGDIIEGRADLAIGDLTITAKRESAVDFTQPFMTLGISILYHKSKKASPSFFSFAEPFAPRVWGMILFAYVVVSTALFVMARLCASEWTNPYPCDEDPDYLVNQLSLRNCFWFTTGAFMQQGTEIAPAAISTRMVAGVWWFFTLIIVSTYTANMASFLTKESPNPPFTNAEELAWIAEKRGIKYGAKSGGATYNYFKEQSSHNPLYSKIFNYLEENKDEVLFEENYLGVNKAETEKYAFFMESTSIEYESQRHCSLEQVGNWLDEKGYGIAMRKNSSYRDELSSAILKLSETGKINDIKKKWWEERRGGGHCKGNDLDTTATSLDVKNLGGVFGVVLIGVLGSAMISFIEFALAVGRLSRKRNLPFCATFRKEILLYFRCAMVKPLSNKSGTSSGSPGNTDAIFQAEGMKNIYL